MRPDPMLETPARVLETAGGAALVQVDYAGGCGSCGTGGCGASLLAQLFSRSPRSALWVANPVGARPGERVVVAVAEGSLLAASILVYLLPLVLLLAGAVAARVLVGGDAAAAAGAVAGLAAGWLAARRLATGQAGQPRILRRL